MGQYTLESHRYGGDFVDRYLGDKFSQLQEAIAEKQRCDIAQELAAHAVMGAAKGFMRAFVYQNDRRHYPEKMSPDKIEKIGTEDVYLIPHNGQMIRALCVGFSGEHFEFHKVHPGNVINRASNVIYIECGSVQMDRVVHSLAPAPETTASKRKKQT